MSIRKAISLSFLLLAGTIILVHAVIPHHHHNGISFISEATHPEHDDLHEICLLSNIYVKKSNENQTFQFHGFDFDTLPWGFTFFSDVIIPQSTDDDCLVSGQEPYLLFHHTKFIARSSGLRAPPFQLRIMN